MLTCVRQTRHQLSPPKLLHILSIAMVTPPGSHLQLHLLISGISPVWQEAEALLFSVTCPSHLPPGPGGPKTTLVHTLRNERWSVTGSFGTPRALGQSRRSSYGGCAWCMGLSWPCAAQIIPVTMVLFFCCFQGYLGIGLLATPTWRKSPFPLPLYARNSADRKSLLMTHIHKKSS